LLGKPSFPLLFLLVIPRISTPSLRPHQHLRVSPTTTTLSGFSNCILLRTCATQLQICTHANLIFKFSPVWRTTSCVRSEALSTPTQSTSTRTTSSHLYNSFRECPDALGWSNHPSNPTTTRVAFPEPPPHDVNVWKSSRARTCSWLWQCSSE
jgi:hypothetical protein